MHCPAAVPVWSPAWEPDSAPPPRTVPDRPVLPPVPVCRARVSGWDRSDLPPRKFPYPTAHMPAMPPRSPAAPVCGNKRKKFPHAPKPCRQWCRHDTPCRECCKSSPVPLSVQRLSPAAAMNRYRGSPASPVPDTGSGASGKGCTAAGHRKPQCRCSPVPALPEGIPAVRRYAP